MFDNVSKPDVTLYVIILNPMISFKVKLCNMCYTRDALFQPVAASHKLRLVLDILTSGWKMMSS